MDVVRNIQVDLSIMKEPRGFLRVIQFVLSILAFATICTSATAFVNVTCADDAKLNTNIAVKYSYPFNLDKFAVDAPFCKPASSQSKEYPLQSISFASSAQFFCFMGVMSFLLCLAYCIAYVVFSPLFANEGKGALVDFVFSAVWTLLWFIASVAWASRLTNMGVYLSPEEIITSDFKAFCSQPGVTCTAGNPGDHATLVVSVLFGFLNMLVWGAGLWFLFKETRWHKEIMPGAAGDMERFDQPHDTQAASTGGYQQPEVTATDPAPTSPGY